MFFRRRMTDIDRIIADAEGSDEFEVGQCIHHRRVDAGERSDAAHITAHLVGDERRIGAFNSDTPERAVDAVDRVVVEIARHQDGDGLQLFGLGHARSTGLPVD